MSNFFACFFVGIEIKSQSRVIFLDDDSSSLLNGFGANATHFGEELGEREEEEGRRRKKRKEGGNGTLTLQIRKFNSWKCHTLTQSANYRQIFCVILIWFWSKNFVFGLV